MSIETPVSLYDRESLRYSVVKEWIIEMKRDLLINTSLYPKLPSRQVPAD